MSDLNPNPNPPGDERWARDTLTKLAFAAVTEQRRTRRWGIFFKLLFFAYLVGLLALAWPDDLGSATAAAKKHTAVVRVDVPIAGLPAALHWYARSQTERTGCAIRVEDRLPALLSPNLETAVFRIVQEAVNNAIRHGQSRRIDITAGVDQKELTLVIQDDGAGFDSDARADIANRSGLGLIGMSERAALLGGRFALVGRPGAGVRIEVAIPLAEEES